MIDDRELVPALLALARDLEQRDDDPFTVRSRSACLRAAQVLRERMTAEEAVRAMGGTPADLAPAHQPDPTCQCPPGVIRGNCPMSYANGGHERGETFGLTEAEFTSGQRRGDNRCCARMRTALGPHTCPTHPTPAECPDSVVGALADGRIGLRIHDGGSAVLVIAFCPWCGTKLDRAGIRDPKAVLLRLASHLLPTYPGDEEEMDSPVVDLEAFGIGREDPETKLLLEHMALGSDDAGWPHFPVAYVARGLSSYLLAVSKAQREAMGSADAALSAGPVRRRTMYKPEEP